MRIYLGDSCPWGEQESENTEEQMSTSTERERVGPHSAEIARRLPSELDVRWTSRLLFEFLDCHDAGGPMYRRASQYGHAGAVCRLSHPAGICEPDPPAGAGSQADQFLPEQGQEYPRDVALLVEQFHGQVPRTMAELTSLPGVARKTANVVLSNAFGIIEGYIVDTHNIRLARRLGLTTHEDPAKIEQRPDGDCAAR